MMSVSIILIVYIREKNHFQNPSKSMLVSPPSLPLALKACKVLKIKLVFSNAYRWQCLVLGSAVISFL